MKNKRLYGLYTRECSATQRKWTRQRPDIALFKEEAVLHFQNMLMAGVYDPIHEWGLRPLSTRELEKHYDGRYYEHG